MHVSIHPGVEPAIRSFLMQLNQEGRPPLAMQSVKAARQWHVAAQQAVPIPVPQVTFQDATFPIGQRGEVSVRIMRPPMAKEGLLPVVVYFHGGGWVLGDVDSFDRLIREMAIGVEAAIVFVNFTRAPEAAYPVALEEGYAALKWIAENGVSLGLDASRLAIAGDSAGANLATAVGIVAKERGGPRIAFQALVCPTTDANFDTPSYREFAEGYFLSRNDMLWFWGQYAPDEGARREPTASPLRAPLEMLRGLPPALVITAEFDVLRDEGEAYARRLMQAGVFVTAVRYLGAVHAFTFLNAIANTPPAKAAIAQTNALLWQALRPVVQPA